MAKGNSERRAIYLPIKTAEVIDRDAEQSTSARVVGMIYAFSEFVSENLVATLTAADYRELVTTWKNAQSEYSTSAIFSNMTKSQFLATSEVVVALISAKEELTDAAINAIVANIKQSQCVQDTMKAVRQINVNGNK